MLSIVTVICGLNNPQQFRDYRRQNWRPEFWYPGGQNRVEEFWPYLTTETQQKILTVLYAFSDDVSRALGFEDHGYEAMILSRAE
jgi:hypothetical protein